MCETATETAPLWLSTAEFAAACGISQSLVGELCETRQIEHHKHGVRGVIRIPYAQVAAYLDLTRVPVAALATLDGTR